MTLGAPTNDRARGIGYGLGAYFIWGLFPLYWPLLKPATALEILSHRVFWTFLLLVVLNSVRRKWAGVGRALGDRRILLIMTAAAMMLAANWGIYIWAVNANRVVDASLGYFINPLVSVAFGVLFLRERLRPLTWVAIGIGFVAILVLAVDHGSVPWVGLSLAFSFGTYGLAKKVANLEAFVSLTVETLVIAPFAVAYLLWLGVHATLVFGHSSVGQSLLSIGSGPVTALPLLLFGVAITRIPLSTIGLLQYATPTGQFILGLWLFHEPMTSLRWVGFVIVWIALAVFTVDNFREGREVRPRSVAEID